MPPQPRRAYAPISRRNLARLVAIAWVVSVPFWIALLVVLPALTHPIAILPSLLFCGVHFITLIMLSDVVVGMEGYSRDYVDPG